MFDHKIAIIGAGVSGLFAAYEIAKAAKAEHPSKKIKIDIYEKSHKQGGNAQTVVFNLGKNKGLPKQELDSDDYVRWADLGVNDINLTAYDNVKNLMKDIGFHDEQWPDDSKRLKPLENTECYFSLDGKTSFTDDDDLKQGVVDPRYSLSEIEDGFLPKWIEILYAAAFKEIEDDDKSLNVTCDEFFNACISMPEARLRRFAEKMPWYKPEEWRWDDSTWLNQAKNRLALLRDNVFYPRISAMYFANEGGPEKMLLAAPFKYYKIQEGADGEEPQRRYFVHGAQKWLEFLADYIEQKMDPQNNCVTINIHYNYEAKVSLFDDRVLVSNAHDACNEAPYDRVVITTHADHALKLLNFKNSDERIKSDTAEILGSISYTTSVAVCHTWSGVLPPNRNLWRAYNVIIRQGAALKPYSMTYVCNRHQNDAANKQYNVFGAPQFFVTLNPQVPIPDNAILRKLPAHKIPPSMRDELPKETLFEARALQKLNEPNKQNSETPSPIEDRAITYFYHNMINKNCFLAQDKLVSYHDGKPRIYFGGAWSYGSGLHEECWLQSNDIAKRIVKEWH